MVARLQEYYSPAGKGAAKAKKWNITQITRAMVEKLWPEEKPTKPARTADSNGAAPAAPAAAEFRSMASLPKLTANEGKKGEDIYRIGDKICYCTDEMQMMPDLCEADAIKWLIELVGYEFNAKHALEYFGREHDGWLFYDNTSINGTWRGSCYMTDEERRVEAERKRIAAEEAAAKKAAEDAKKAQEVADKAAKEAADKLQEEMRRQSEEAARKELGLTDEKYDGWVGFPTILQTVKTVCSFQDPTKELAINFLKDCGLDYLGSITVINDLEKARTIRVSEKKRLEWTATATGES